MCHALLTTCRECTWILSITYPRCSHAKAYAIPPPSCPHRMARRYKASGLCSACKTTRKHTPKLPNISSSHTPSPTLAKFKESPHRKASLSITPCAVLIAFRDTELGAVVEADKPANSDPSIIPSSSKKEAHESRDDERAQPQHKPTPSHDDTRSKRLLRRTHARTRAQQQHQPPFSSVVSETDADAYIASPSPSPSASSSTSTSPTPLPRRHAQSRPRRRSPGVLERIAIAKSGAPPVKKGRRGRPPKRKVEWPDRVDAGAWEEVVREREKKEEGRGVRGRGGVGGGREKRGRERGVEGWGGEGGGEDLRKMKMAWARGDVEGRMSYGEAERVVGVERGMGNRKDNEFGVEEGENIARVIALEAAQREKKWR